jgi:hypothetical protein
LGLGWRAHIFAFLFDVNSQEVIKNVTQNQDLLSKIKDKFYSFIATTGLGKDLHPSPFQQKEWLNNIAAPKLNITINKEEQDVIVNSIDDLYKSIGINSYREKLDNELTNGNFNKPEKMNWPNTYKGLY